MWVKLWSVTMGWDEVYCPLLSYCVCLYCHHMISPIVITTFTAFWSSSYHTCHKDMNWHNHKIIKSHWKSKQKVVVWCGHSSCGGGDENSIDRQNRTMDCTYPAPEARAWTNLTWHPPTITLAAIWQERWRRQAEVLGEEADRSVHS